MSQTSYSPIFSPIALTVAILVLLNSCQVIQSDSQQVDVNSAGKERLLIEISDSSPLTQLLIDQLAPKRAQTDKFEAKKRQNIGLKRLFITDKPTEDVPASQLSVKRRRAMVKLATVMHTEAPVKREQSNTDDDILILLKGIPSEDSSTKSPLRLDDGGLSNNQMLQLPAKPDSLEEIRVKNERPTIDRAEHSRKILADGFGILKSSTISHNNHIGGQKMIGSNEED